MKFSKLLRAKRLEQPRSSKISSQAGLAIATGFSRFYVNQVEQGFMVPSPKFMQKVCKLLDIDPDSFDPIP